MHPFHLFTGISRRLDNEPGHIINIPAVMWPRTWLVVGLRGPLQPHPLLGAPALTDAAGGNCSRWERAPVRIHNIQTRQDCIKTFKSGIPMHIQDRDSVGMAHRWYRHFGVIAPPAIGTAWLWDRIIIYSARGGE